ncbi:hypothetical protein K437DRAFT_255491 [Tilletiaria anomala UBC 951]|uniref:DBF4-type domain-containing protein n=1 Tax=Tilletiaria anomala (strain ATCC 24038 / CBS 436.72 / UBC 951) TaxID=1037660 RepID=A0A066W3H8_TILAU|nr:uncharacterized protein K437DRAFT_255491 [Tilletiaria anomala UBC 951]KDN48517.1 hypothetical protein K437DRAFT_255491 [Tilletiaria anomala UBC 951]
MAVTPKKRAVPLEQVHFRNTAPSPSKRSRSSKTESSMDVAADAPSTGTGENLAMSISGFTVRDQHPLPKQEAPGATTLLMGKDQQHGKKVIAKTNRSVTETTTRIDKYPRISEAERMAREKQRAVEMAAYRNKYRKAFPTFIFYLDDFNDAEKEELAARVEALGGHVEPFFSKSCTHLVSGRSSFSKREAAGKGSSRAGDTALRAKENMNLPVAARNSLPLNQVPIHSDRNPFDENARQQSNDVLTKAARLNIRIWVKQKFLTILDTLEDKVQLYQPPEVRHDLSHMLHQEKLHGTLERDLLAQRQDHYYFSKGCYYLLVEDATGEHRPIAIEEHKKTGPHHDPSWPVLYNDGEGRCPFTRCEAFRRRQQGPSQNAHQTLRRSVSLSQLRKPLFPPPADLNPLTTEMQRDYPLASGNSVAITSNWGSTTSALNEHAGAGGQAAMDPRVAQLSRRTMTMTPSGHKLGAMYPKERLGPVRQLLAMRAANKGANPLAGMRRSVSTNDAVQREREDKKPGYCENCRVKYDDFDEHIASRKHRKFAVNELHFVEIDSLISRVEREVVEKEDYDDHPFENPEWSDDHHSEEWSD